MTCAHVLGLIDAGPFAAVPPAHLDAAWQHARHCATCGPALKTATMLTAELNALPQPGPPADLTAVVLARIARIEQARPALVAAQMAETNAPDWSAAGTVLGSLAAGLALSMAPGEGAMATPRLGGLPAAWALILAASLGLYAAGLFAPLARKHR